jgi:transketolase
MIEINNIKMRTWSMLGMRRSFGAILSEIAHEMPSLFVMSADLKSSSGLDRFADAYPKQFNSVGIAEQNMICIASGLASEGKVVFITSFSPFITGRPYDQIRTHLAYMRHNVKLVGLGAGIGLGVQGNSHYGLDDISLMRSLPNMVVISPADCRELAKMIYASYDYDGPVYLRLTGEKNVPILFKENYNFQMGKSIIMKEGNDIAIVACGTMVYQSLKAAEILEGNGFSTQVINMHTIKPLDTGKIDLLCKSVKLLVTAEEASVIGGLGSAVAEYKTTIKNAPPQLLLGIKDCFPKVGDYAYMLEQNDLRYDKMADSILDKINSL